MRRIFLDVGHMYGTRPGAEHKTIIEGPYNDSIANTLEGLWRTRVSLENLLSMSFIQKTVLGRLDIVTSLPYILLRSDEESNFLMGTYKEKAKSLNEHDYADVVVQMHLNGAGGKYGVVGFDVTSPHKKISLELANIAAEELNRMSSENGDIISTVKVLGCSAQSEDRAERNIHYCLNDYDVPAILMEPLFLDNEVHNAFLASDEGELAMVMLYSRIFERIGTVCIN